MHSLQCLIESAFEIATSLSPESHPPEVKEAVQIALAELEQGTLRVATPSSEGWQTHEWVKKAILLAFRIFPHQFIEGGPSQGFDKLPPQFRTAAAAERLKMQGTRLIPPAMVRTGAHIGRQVILMPSFVNVGAYIDEGTLIDTWATVGSGAQIGKRVHLSGGAGIGGVLEPLQAQPTIIEDDCFIGARSEIVEGVVVERNAVIGMGVFIGQSTRIFDRNTGAVYQGRVPAGSVVVSGSLPDKTQRCHLYAAIIVKTVDEQTRRKVGLNQLLRELALEGT